MKKLLITACATLALAACTEENELPQAQSSELVGTEPQISIIYNAIIHTVNEDMPLVSGMAFSADGRILGLGAIAMLTTAYPDAQVHNLSGLTIIPGLIDAHGHLTGLARQMTHARLNDTRSQSEIIERLQAHEALLAEGDWLLGRGWDQNEWPEPVFPDRKILDLHFPDRPVWLSRVDGHAGWANSAALALVDRDLSGDWQPQGGRIHRDAEGRPTGVLIDGAEALVDDVVPPQSEALIQQGLDMALQQLTSLGLTGVHDPGLNRVGIERYLQRIEAQQFPVRAYVMTDGAGETLDWLCQNGAIDHDSGRLVVRASKLYQDGALGSRGAALLDDYNDDPGNKGLLFHDPQSLATQIEKVLACGFQAAVHAIGDRANRTVLDAYEQVIPKQPDNPGRHRIEHVQVLSANDQKRLAQLGLVASVQPTHATSDMYWAAQRLGPERVSHGYVWQGLAELNTRLALGSDFPVEEVNPFHGIYAAVSRMDLQGTPEGGWYPGQALSREQALRGFTLDAAWAAFMEDEVGSLAVGKRADFLVLDRDIMKVDLADLPTTRVLETWLDGKRVYSIAVYD